MQAKVKIVCTGYKPRCYSMYRSQECHINNRERIAPQLTYCAYSDNTTKAIILRVKVLLLILEDNLKKGRKKIKKLEKKIIVKHLEC